MAAPILEYEIRYRRNGISAPWTVRRFPADSNIITLTGLERGVTYEGEARSIGPGGIASAWVAVTFTAANAVIAPRAPTNLTAQSVADGVALSWQVDAEQAAGVEYIVERGSGVSGPWAEVARVRSTRWTDPVADSAVYWYRVKAVSFAGVSSAYSNVVSENGVVLGGSGVNLLPDEYSFFAQSALPQIAITEPTRSAISRDPAVSYFGSGSLKMSALAADAYIYLSPSFGTYNIPVVPGKSYIVSAFVRCNQASKPGQFYLYAGGGHYGSIWTTDPTAGVWKRVSAVITPDPAANSMSLRLDNDGGAGCDMWFDGIMVEERVGNATTPSNYGRGNASGLAVSAIAAAATAQDTADGKIETFYQPSPPAIGTGSDQARLGDLWFDTDDGNKLYRCNGSSWVAAQDAAIGQAINLAAGAQATADGKVTTYYSSTQPTATAVGDLWYDTSRKTLYRWSGSQWVLVGDNSLETQATATLVKDGGFEAGGQGWMFAPNAYTDRASGVPYIGSAALTHAGVAGWPIRQSACEMFAVAPGERIVAEAMLRNYMGGADGYAVLAIWFYDEAGNFIATGAFQFYADGRDAGSYWRKCTALALVPANARLCRIGLETNNSYGYWIADQFRALKQPQVEPQPSNLIPNANFGGINGDLAPWQGGWNPAGANIFLRNKKTGLISGTAWLIDGSTGVLEVAQSGRGGGSPGVVDITCGSTYNIAVVGGQRYELHMKTANHRCESALTVGWYDSAGAFFAESSTPYVRGFGGKKESDYVQVGAFVVAPANAAYARVWIRRTDTDAGQSDSYAWYLKPYFGPAKEDQQEFSPWVPGPIYTADEIATGSFGVVSAQDLWDAGGTRRIGLRVHGSGHRLGSQSNAPQSLTTAYGSVRNTTALTATSSGAVSVNAHVVRYGGFSVSYNAVPNAVTGLAQNTRYVIYCFDPDYTGGTKTWYAGTNPDAVMQLGDGVVIAGEVTIPTSGTGSGGGGGGDPHADWCVDATMRLPDGRIAGDIAAGDIIACWDENAATPGVQERDVESNTLVESQPCTRIMTVSGAAVVASDCTPMTLRDGRIVRITEMFGEDALVRHADGTLAWEPVVSCTAVGSRTVAKIKVHQLCYFAGESTAATIATHNPIYKP